MNAPPAGSAPSKNESPNATKKIHIISASGMLNDEYERQIKINEIVATRAEPPRANTENNGIVNPLLLRRIPRLSFACRFVRGKTKEHNRYHQDIHCALSLLLIIILFLVLSKIVEKF